MPLSGPRRLAGRDAQLGRAARGEFGLPDRTGRAQEKYRVCDMKNTTDLTNMKGSREIIQDVPLGLSKSREMIEGVSLGMMKSRETIHFS